MKRNQFIIILSILFITSSCSLNKQGGMSFGMKGSPMWIKSAPQKEVDEYFTSKPVYELCMIWTEKYDKNFQEIRIQIARSLEIMGEDPMKCNNPDLDNERRRIDAAENLVKERRRRQRNREDEIEEMKDRKDEIKEMKQQLEAACRASGKILIGKQCL